MNSFLALRLTLLSLLLPAIVWAQRPLEIEDLNRWQTIEEERLSADGRWIAYVLKPDQGDPTTLLYDTQTQKEWRFARADRPRFSAAGGHLVFMIHPATDSLKAMRRRGAKPDKLPGDTLGILSLEQADLLTVPEVQSYQLPEKEGNWLVYAMKSPLPDSLAEGLPKKSYRLVFRHLSTGETLSLEGVTQYQSAEEQAAWLAVVGAPDSIQPPGVYHFDATAPKLQRILPGKGTFPQLTLSREGNRVAILADRDTTKARIRPFALYGWETGQAEAHLLQTPRADWMPEGWRLSEHAKLSFSHNQSRLFLGIAPDPILQDTSLLEEEIVQVEVWATSQSRLYTRQEDQLARDRKMTYFCLLEWKSGDVLPFATAERDAVKLSDRGDGRYALALDDRPYRYRRSYEGTPVAQDAYLLDLQTGARKQIAHGVRARFNWSPGGTYVYWYDVQDTAHFAYSIQDQQTRQLTSTRMGTFFDEEHDAPSRPYPYGVAGWSEGDQSLYLYDRYDWWVVDPAKERSARRLTQFRPERLQLRYIKVEPEARFLEKAPLVYLFDEGSRQSGYGRLDLKTGSLKELQRAAASFARRVRKARKAEAYLYTQESFTRFPDLVYSSDLTQGTTISQANPQQQAYRWGSIELVSWTSLDGQKLEGLLVKPEGFDPNKQYPMIVNFYERSSNGLHRHRAPYAHRSTLNYAYYASRGYVIFNPDVPYRIGYPGESAYNAVMSGVTAIMDQGFVDPERIGLQGHSWGGYQIAHLVTETDLFACAESGAPVVNMISAYGGIRWGSGLSRQFQYEQSQSRIGGTPWEYPMRYVENSPIFFLDKVNTPVLILHNDNDGAVPWYQGIEFFAGLRRLGKPAWMLNYNGEPHWPLKYANRVDFQRRMSQFFDYYLMEGPQPRWMKEGVSPLEKGIRQGYEPVESGE